MNDVLRIARLKIALQRAFLGRAILIFTVIIVFTDKGDCNRNDNSCDDCDDCTYGSDAGDLLKEGCLITGGAKEIYAPAHLVNKRIIISFSNVWQIFFATLPVDV